MICYSSALEGLTPDHLSGGFFEGWPNPPSPENHLRILLGSYRAVLAWDGDRVVGFVNAISDGVSTAFIPLLEVLPAYRGQGIGSTLIQKLLDELGGLYAIDLACDESKVSFYRELGFQPGRAMHRRNFDRQSCEP